MEFRALQSRNANQVTSALSSANFYEKLFQNIKALDDFLDVVLWIDGKTIRAHRFILAAGSQYFHQMMKCGEIENKMPIFVLRDMKYDHVVRIVKYLYSGKVQVPANELDEFFRIARELKILGLSYGNRRNGGTTDTCVTFLLNSVESDRENQVTPSTIDQRDAEQPSTSQQAQQPRAADDTGDPFPVTPSRLLNAPDRMQARTPVSRISPPSQFTTSTPDSNSVIMTTAVGNVSRPSRESTTSRQSVANIKCNGCEEVFCSVRLLMRHKKYKCGKDKNFLCPTCKKKFYLRIGLKNHLKQTRCVGPAPGETD